MVMGKTDIVRRSPLLYAESMLFTAMLLTSRKALFPCSAGFEGPQFGFVKLDFPAGTVGGK